jgi:hypothetical protein
VGVSNGIAQLGPDGRLATNQIPSSLLGAVQFAGGWDASANNPPLSNGTGTTGTEYVITVSGTRSLGTQTGTVSYLSGGFVIYGAGVWNYTPSVSNFTSISGINHISVNTGTGVIQITSDATPNNTTATIVARDSSGNFQANVITANLTGNVTGNVTGSLTGNAQTASKLNSAVSINGVSFDGSTNIQVNNTSTLTFGTGFNTGSYNGSVPVTITLNTSTLVANAVNAQVATTATNAGYAYSFNTSTLVANAVNAQVANTTTNFNTGTLVTTAVTAGKVANALTAGFGLKLSSGTTYDGSSALTLNKYDTVTGPISVTGNAYALDLSTATSIVILDNANAAFQINLSNPVVGKTVRVMVTSLKGAPAVTLAGTGLSTANSSNGTLSFTSNLGGPTTTYGLVELICTTSALSGVFINIQGGAK